MVPRTTFPVPQTLLLPHQLDESQLVRGGTVAEASCGTNCHRLVIVTEYNDDHPACWCHTPVLLQVLSRTQQNRLHTWTQAAAEARRL
jgi:hypothetical protein